MIAIGVSTGGPAALQYLFAQLPADFPGCLLVVQHMPENFTKMFAKRLNETCAIEVKEARSGDLLLAGRALICPGNRHMKVRRHGAWGRGGACGQPRGERPSAVGGCAVSLGGARIWQGKALGVMMTGMGEDGVAGLGEIQAAGGFTLAQSPETCVVDSMPRVGDRTRVCGASRFAFVVWRRASGEITPTEKILAELSSVEQSSGLTEADRISRRR